MTYIQTQFGSSGLRFEYCGLCVGLKTGVWAESLVYVPGC